MTKTTKGQVKVQKHELSVRPTDKIYGLFLAFLPPCQI